MTRVGKEGGVRVYLVRPSVAVASSILGLLVMTGCQFQETGPTESGGSVGISDAETNEVGEGTEAPPAPLVYLPDGSAAQNEKYFRQVLTQAGAGAGRVSGSDMVKAVSDAGFELDLIELTPDTSLIALPADTVTLAVRMGDDCLVGQWGKDWVVSQVAPVLDTGVCLVGDANSLD